MNRRRLAVCWFILAIALGVMTTIAISWLAMFLPWNDRLRWHGPPALDDVGVVARSDHMKTYQVSRGRNAWHEVTTYWWMQISGRSLTMPIDSFEARRIDLASLQPHMRPERVEDLNTLSWYHSTGWPLHAMTCSVHWEQQILNSNVIYSVSGGVQLPRDSEFNPRALPLTPLWPGFAINSLAFATLWWLVMSGSSAMRRAHRRRANRCVECGYSRRGIESSSPCPECGSGSY